MTKSERAKAIANAERLYRAADASGRDLDYWEARAAMAAALRPSSVNDPEFPDGSR